MAKFGPTPMPVMVRGQLFANAKECAAHFDVHVDSVYAAIRDGRADRIGLGKGAKPESNPNYGGGRPQSIRLLNTTFKSLADANNELGWAPKRLERMIRGGGPKQLKTLYGIFGKAEIDRVRQTATTPLKGGVQSKKERET
jgi:hypothetical protein